MPAIDVMAQLPPEVVERINARLIARGFGSGCYRVIAGELAAEGVTVSLRTLQRHGKKLREDDEERNRAIAVATAQSSAVIAAAGKQPTAIAAASNRILQHTLLKIQTDPDRELDLEEVNQVALALHRSVRSDKVLEDLAARAAKAAGAAVDKAARQHHLSAATADAIREAVTASIRTTRAEAADNE